jgi:signal transduction histidine kinase
MTKTWRGRWIALSALMMSVLLINVVLGLTHQTTAELVGQIAAALLFAALGLWFYNHIRDEFEQLRILFKISEEVSSTVSLEDLLDNIVRAALQLLPLADKCVIHLLDETGRRLVPYHSSRPDTEQSLGMPANKGIAGQALQELRIQVVPEARQHPEFLPLRSGEDLRSLIVAPLHAQGKPLGTISLNSGTPAAFTKRDELLITTLAAQAAVAIYQNRLYDAARRETHHIEAIINNLDAGLVVLDGEGRVLRYNPALAHFLGTDTASIVGQKPSLQSEYDGLRRLAFVMGERPTNPRQSYERQVQIDDPFPAVLHVNVLSVQEGNGSWGQLVLLHDQTEQLDLIQAKSSFLAAASRELHPPLEAIRGYATLLANLTRTDPTTIMDWARQIRAQSARLMRLAEDLADLCVVDTKQIEIKLELVAVQGLVADVVAEIQPAAARARVALDYRCPDGLPAFSLDADRVRHVLLNLIENALQRARPGGQISLRVEANLEELIFTLSDNGAPLPPEAQERVFQGRFRTNGATPQDPGGTGLGLYISRKLVEAHGGHLWLAEHGEQGAEFQFILPIAPVQRA